MSKTIAAGMETHLLLEVTTLANCWRVTRTDGVEFFFTDHDVDIIFDGNTYIAETGYNRTAIQNDSTLAVDNLDVQGILDSTQIKETELRAGLFDFAQIRIFMVNWENLSNGDIKMRNGRLGEVTMSAQGIFSAELRGLSQALSQQIGEVYQPECRADLGDAACKIPIDPPVVARLTAYEVGDFVRVSTAAGTTQEQYENRIYECTTAGTTDAIEPAYDTIVGNTTADDSAVFTARQAWTRHAVVDTVTNNKLFTLTGGFDEARDVDGWFDGGAMEFEDGDNNGKLIEIRGWVQSTREITMFLSTAFAIASGAKVRLYPGCDKRLVTCIGKFVMPGSTNFANGNVKNFRGEPHIPGQDELIKYPDAKT